jgi:stage IV sporulation protein FB
MQFKFKNIKITISFTFFALILLLFIFRKNDFLHFTCFFAIIHELGHLFALNKFGVKISEFKISLFGANIKTESFKKIPIKNEIIILFSGPLINFTFSIVLYFINLFIKNEMFNKLILINLGLAIFNLLPFYNFDGGKIIETLFKYKLKEKTADILLTCISIIVLIPITLFSINAFLQNYNDFYYLVVSALMLLTIILKK